MPWTALREHTGVKVAKCWPGADLGLPSTTLTGLGANFLP